MHTSDDASWSSMKRYRYAIIRLRLYLHSDFGSQVLQAYVDLAPLPSAVSFDSYGRAAAVPGHDEHFFIKQLYGT